MNIHHHEVSLKVVNSYQSMEVINAFYALFNCRPKDIKIIHRYHPSNCRRDIQIFAEDKLVHSYTFEVMGNEQVQLLINAQVVTEPNYLQSLVLRDVYNFLQKNAIDYHTRLLEQVRTDYRETDTDLAAEYVSPSA